jgi:hypothetical protein
MIALFQHYEDLHGPERECVLVHCGDFDSPVDLLNEVARTVHGPDAKVLAIFDENCLKGGVEAVELRDFCDERSAQVVKSRSMDPVVDRYLAWLKEARR